MNKGLNVFQKIIISLFLFFSFLKILIFPSHIFSMIQLTVLKLKGEPLLHRYEDIVFSKWIFLTSLIESGLFLILFIFVMGMLKGKLFKRKVIYISLLTILYYPILLVLNYFILGKNSLLGVIPDFFSIFVLLLFTLYLVFFYKSKIGTDTTATSNHTNQ